MTGPPTEYSFLRYLAAKKGLDDRSLNRQVRETMAAYLLQRTGPPPLRVLEVGCGIGTMLERLIDWQVLGEAIYIGIDLDPQAIAEARARFRRYAAAQGAELVEEAGCFHLRKPHLSITAAFEACDFYDFLSREPGLGRWDLIIAHSVLDLVDLGTALPRLLGRLAPGGFFYFTLNFDGTTVFEPPIEPALDRLIETLYHETMDQRRVDGRISGSSRTGRLLFEHLKNAGATVLASGPSDWVVLPGRAGYPGDEAYFLHFIIHTIQQALKGHPQLPAADFEAWLKERHEQVQRQELIYVAHQLDFFGQV